MTQVHHPSPPADRTPDTIGMLIAHRVLTADLAAVTAAAGAVARAGACEPRRATAFAAYVAQVIEALHHHHSVEDDVLWPLLERAVGPHLDLTELRDDHADLDLDGVLAAATAFAAAADELTATALARRLSALQDALVEHLAEEERMVLPLVEEHLSVQDWATVERRAGQSGLPISFELTRAWAVTTHEERVRLLGPVQARLMGLLHGLVARRQRRRAQLALGAT